MTEKKNILPSNLADDPVYYIVCSSVCIHIRELFLPKQQRQC